MMKSRILFPLAVVITLIPIIPSFALVAGGCGTACIQGGGVASVSEIQFHDLTLYGWRQLLLILSFYLSGYLLCPLAERKMISASLSRKFICLVTFAVSYANSLSVPAYSSFFTSVLVLFGCIVILLMLGSLAEPSRRRIYALRKVFTAINRPEDEPYTLAWLATEAVVTSLVIIIFIPVIGYFAEGFVSDRNILYRMMLIPVFASGIGDALAEIVGKKWGRHQYKTHSIFGGRSYTRSLEGSSMVFLTTLIVGLIVALSFDFHMPIFFWKALILLPITLTLAEAKAPHTWDNPLLYLVGYLTIILCLL